MLTVMQLLGERLEFVTNKEINAEKSQKKSTEEFIGVFEIKSLQTKA